jgi:hypothetical protein
MLAADACCRVNRVFDLDPDALSILRRRERRARASQRVFG